MEQKKSDRWSMPLILLVGFLLYMSNFMVNATASLFADSMSATGSVVGLIGGAFGFMALGIRPFSGQIVDKENNRHILFAAIGLIIISNLCLLFAQKPFWVLMSRGIFGLSWGICSTLLMTAACNALSGSKTAFGISAFTMTQELARLVGPFLALKFLNNHSFSSLYTITMAFSVFALFLAVFFRPKQIHKKDTKYSFSPSQFFIINNWPLPLVSLGNYMIIHSMNAFVILYATSLDIADLSWFFALQAVVMLLARPLMTICLKGQYSKGFVIFCEIIMICGVIILFNPRGTVTFVISAVMQGVANAGAQPALMDLCVKFSAPEYRGKATSTNYIGCDLGVFLGPIISGIIVQAWGYKYVFLILSFIIGVLLCIFVHYFKPSNEK